MEIVREGKRGLLLYLKLSVTGNELETIRRYRILHPDFPHQTTLDQFFDEEQFEAYRQLGVHPWLKAYFHRLCSGANSNLQRSPNGSEANSLKNLLLLPEK